MNIKTRYLAIVLVLLLATLACQIGAGGADTNVTSGGVLFEDDFSGESGGWDTVTVDEGITDYGGGVYRILVDEVNYYMWANPKSMTLNDVQVEVDATKAGGPDANDIGIICRYQDEQNFYFLTIGSDGYFAVSKLVDGEENLIGMEQLGFDDQTINTGNATNHLRVDCIGNQLSLYANGTQLASVQDSDLTEGNVGLIAGTWETPGTDIHFDNFKVIKP